MALTKPLHSDHHHLSTLSTTTDFSSSPSSPSLHPSSETKIDLNPVSPPSTLYKTTVKKTSPEVPFQQGSNSNKHRQSTLSTNSSRSSRTGLSTLAALALAKTTTAIASLSDPKLRSRSSASSLLRQPTQLVNNSVPTTATSDSGKLQEDRPRLSRSSGSNISLGSNLRPRVSDSNSLGTERHILLDTDPLSQSYEDTDFTTASPVNFIPYGDYNKMHQTSSRLLRMTDDERPFTRDFKDLFATLIVSLPLHSHRLRLTRIDHSFLSEDAINNLGSLKFSQSNRMPDPKDPSRIVTTTTTTTFSMAREMARSVCQRFIDARFIESADGRQLSEFTLRGTVWQLTPKGIHVLDRFCVHNGIHQNHVSALLNSQRNTMQLVILERDPITDELSADRSTIEVIFRRFIGQNGPNIKSSTSSADSDSLSEYKDGIAGVRMANERKVGSPPRSVFQTFTGKAACDWLMDCCTTVDRRETVEIAKLFMDQELLWCVQADRGHVQMAPHEVKFQPTKSAIYQVTKKGKEVLNMTMKERLSNGDDAAVPARAGVSRDSNTQKLDKILNDAALRLLFREYLRDTHCEENLTFYLDVSEFLKACKNAIKVASPARSSAKAALPGLDAIKETMASAYGIYNAFLAPGSPCELNIDHMLRNQLATRMTKSVGQDGAMVESLKEVTKLFEEAQVSVFKLMASDSVPKFMKSPKHEQILLGYDFARL